MAGTDLGGLEGLSGVQWTGVVMATTGVYAAILALPLLTLRIIALGQSESAREPRAGRQTAGRNRKADQVSSSET